jgi:WD repeat-containing protein 45
MSINSLSFNDIVTNLAVSTDQGFIVYSIENNLEKLKAFNNLNGSYATGVGIVRILKRTNMALIIGSNGDTNKILTLLDIQKNESIIEIDMKESIRNILINATHLFVVLQEKIVVFDWRGRHLYDKLTYFNPKGLCIMNANGDTLAFPGLNKGEVAVWKYASDKYKIIKAHLTNIDALALNSVGNYIATASETGTLVRIHNVDTETKKYEFRRGTNYASVYDICFNNDTTLLACCSSNGTVHIWDLTNDPEANKNVQSRLSSFKGYLPQYFSSEWSMTTSNLGYTSKAICAFDKNNDLHVVTYEGQYFKIAGKTGLFETFSTGNLHINNK